MKRFYKLVSTRAEQGGFAVLLDGKPVKTPGRNLLFAPNQAIADEVMREWMAQVDQIRPQDMPFTQILSAKLDRVASMRAGMYRVILDYLDTDLICYRAVAPPEVASLQAEAWDPWLQWFEQKFNVRLLTTEKLEALKQPKTAHDVAKKFVEALSDDQFTILQILTPLVGSLILAMAFVEGALNPDQIFACARVEERYKATLYNEEKYGPDPAQEKKDRAMMIDLRATEEYLRLIS